MATRTCVGLQRGLPGRRRAWQVQVALNRCYYMLNRRRRLTSATPSVLGDAIWLRCGECGAGSRCMQDLMKRGERRTDLPRDAIRMRSFFPPAEIAMYIVLSPSVISARVVSARSRPLGHAATRPHRSPFGTIRLWYDIAVFVAVLSFHSARYRSDYVPRRPLEARVISARSRPRPHTPTDLGSPC